MKFSTSSISTKSSIPKLRTINNIKASNNTYSDYVEINYDISDKMILG